ncbi:hypothetical protein Hden_3009 [Hyphomicrobium denitrificans ATCC 51888]|uniref:Uncharacterized protein n=1 Tax=Hyphomicrobium denitrificans (strain ATCC 51888 / DSM 1869 / NCIMB 11706 / TK 0415) TaxID=582899 RepID=D8JVF0_HYPDA|nr:hypothetical protein [Hyphomicrobium denitrificans]ADJ24804.1 hypothetical protein Hden_3009 [Hyphomicrobium denitrificans ATCC 51888]
MTPEQRTQFIANVPDAEARREAERLFQAAEDAWDKLREACGSAHIDVDGDVIENHGDPAIVALNDAYDKAHAKWEDCEEYGPVVTDELDAPTRCVLTGFLIHEDDGVLVDRSTGEQILKTALGLPLYAVTGEFISPSDEADAMAASAEAVA